jgi:N-acetylmuramoyl-L-alanine amidase
MHVKMTTPLKTQVVRALLCLSLACVFTTVGFSQTAKNNGWKVIKIEGKDYLSVQDIQRFYNFTRLTRTGNTVALENSKVEMKLTVGGNECLMNNVKFVFSDPVVASGNGVYVSRIDLAKLIDPVLRPSYIKNAGNFRTVILDAGHGGKDSGSAPRQNTISSSPTNSKPYSKQKVSKSSWFANRIATTLSKNA